MQIAQIEEEDELYTEENFSQDDRMSVEDDPGDNEEEELKDEQPPQIDQEGEIVYDPNASRPDYKLFTLRANSCLDYHNMIELGQVGKKNKNHKQLLKNYQNSSSS